MECGFGDAQESATLEPGLPQASWKMQQVLQGLSFLIVGMNQLLLVGGVGQRALSRGNLMHLYPFATCPCLYRPEASLSTESKRKHSTKVNHPQTEQS